MKAPKDRYLWRAFCAESYIHNFGLRWSSRRTVLVPTWFAAASFLISQHPHSCSHCFYHKWGSVRIRSVWLQAIVARTSFMSGQNLVKNTEQIMVGQILIKSPSAFCAEGTLAHFRFGCLTWNPFCPQTCSCSSPNHWLLEVSWKLRASFRKWPDHKVLIKSPFAAIN